MGVTGEIVTKSFSIVCLSSQQWRSELPTNRHQIMLRAARRGHDVLFVETGGFLGRHLWRLVRGGERRSLAARLFATEQVDSNIRVRKAMNILPWGQRFRFASSANSAATALVLRPFIRRLPAPVVVWIYDPSAAGIATTVRDATSVYDCVDDYAEQVGPDARRRAVVAAADDNAARHSRVVFATTRTLYERHKRRNLNTHLVPNAADYAHFAPAAEREFAAPDVGRLQHPVIGFAGNFLPSKVDFGLIQALAVRHPDWSILLIGPASSGSREKLDGLTKIPNVTWLGIKPYAELPRYVSAFDVGVIPYRANEYTRSCFPLKVYEYLAAGKPVVASGLPELAGMEPDVALAEGPNEFIIAVEKALGEGTRVARDRRMALARQHTWEARTNTLLELVAAQIR
jgi:glycosyltransferase involved in cell wall biosynthesis